MRPSHIPAVKFRQRPERLPVPLEEMRYNETYWKLIRNPLSPIDSR